MFNILKGLIFIFEPVKREKTATAILSLLLSALVLTGSTGITVLIRHCHAHGYTLSTGIFSQPDMSGKNCCGNADESCAAGKNELTEGGCCTFTSEKLKLTNYLSSGKVAIAFLPCVQPVRWADEINQPPVSVTKPVSYHNKHGGRDVVISVHNLLI